MTKGYPIPHNLRPYHRRAQRVWRQWLWGLACFLYKGSIAAAFYLAMRNNPAGLVTLGAFGCGLVLRKVLEATSQGD